VLVLNIGCNGSHLRSLDCGRMTKEEWWLTWEDAIGMCGLRVLFRNVRALPSRESLRAGVPGCRTLPLSSHQFPDFAAPFAGCGL
jgi:hypothetical protein